MDDDDIPEKVPRPTVGLLQNASKFSPGAKIMTRIKVVNFLK